MTFIECFEAAGCSHEAKTLSMKTNKRNAGRCVRSYREKSCSTPDGDGEEDRNGVCVLSRCPFPRRGDVCGSARDDFVRTYMPISLCILAGLQICPTYVVFRD
ncbi:unnamed protein product [Hapterophycus canaliculatus]